MPKRGSYSVNKNNHQIVVHDSKMKLRELADSTKILMERVSFILPEYLVMRKLIWYRVLLPEDENPNLFMIKPLKAQK
jgi:hypothetical protein